MKNISELKKVIEAIEPRLKGSPFVELQAFERDGRTIHVAITERLRASAKRGRVWKSRPFLATLANAAYGYSAERPRSRGGLDGVFRVDRDYRSRRGEKPELVKKLYDQYIDRPDNGLVEIAEALGVEVGELVAVRVVSHHMRLLGVLARGDADHIVLVDYDDTKD